MRDPVVLLLIAVGLVVSVAQAFPSVLFYWWLAIFRPQDWTWTDISFLRISLLSGIIVVVGCTLRGYLPRVRGVTGAMLLGFVACSVVAHVQVGCAFSSLWLDHVLRLILILLITDRFLTSVDRVVQLMAVLGGSLLFYASKAGFGAIMAGGRSVFAAFTQRLFNQDVQHRFHDPIGQLGILV